jgi:phosphate starvation-inducible membrane PsiE
MLFQYVKLGPVCYRYVVLETAYPPSIQFVCYYYDTNERNDTEYNYDSDSFLNTGMLVRSGMLLVCCFRNNITLSIQFKWYGITIMITIRIIRIRIRTDTGMLFDSGMLLVLLVAVVLETTYPSS